MKVKKFKKFIQELEEETTSGDIATVDNKIDLTKRMNKGKKCKKHKRINCQECEDEKWN